MVVILFPKRPNAALDASSPHRLWPTFPPSTKTGHHHFQIRPPSPETGQYGPAHKNIWATLEHFGLRLATFPRNGVLSVVGGRGMPDKKAHSGAL
jgi:hypothetical protein